MGFAPLSIPVEPNELAQQLHDRRFAYLITVTDNRSHVVALVPEVNGAVLGFTTSGKTTRRDIDANSRVTIVWPPSESSEYSLIADGDATVHGDEVRVVVGRAVLHRPA